MITVTIKINDLKNGKANVDLSLSRSNEVTGIEIAHVEALTSIMTADTPCPATYSELAFYFLAEYANKCQCSKCQAEQKQDQDLSISIIKPVKVQRDEYGMWVHPELPEWGENASSEQVEAWFVSQGLTHHLVLMDGALSERWFDGDLKSCAEWQPKPKVKDSFLVGIWDNEDGVVAMFASPLM